MKKFALLLTFLLFQSFAFADGCDSTTILLMHYDGTDASTTFTDENCDGSGAHTFTANDNAQLDTAQKKFGTASVLFDGTTDFIYANDSPDWTIGAGNFTMDFWLRLSSTGGFNQSLVSHGESSSRNFMWILITGSNLYADGSTDGSSWGLAPNISWVPVINTWYHIAIVRSGTNLYFFIDGVQQGVPQAFSGTLFNSTAVLRIGAGSGAGDPMFGWIDEFRWSNYAVWTSDFTPPTEAYSAGGGGGAGTDGMFLCFE